MKAQEVVQYLQGKAGQHVNVSWSRKAKTRGSCPFEIIKHTSAFVRTGIKYANLQAVKSEIAAGNREQVGQLPFGHWRPGFENYIIDHNGTEYVRLYPASFDNLSEPQVSWTMDGITATFDDVKLYLKRSEDKREHQSACFTVKAEDINSVGAEDSHQHEEGKGLE